MKRARAKAGRSPLAVTRPAPQGVIATLTSAPETPLSPTDKASISSGPLPSVQIRGCNRMGSERGDVNADQELNLTDAIAILAYLFQGAAAPSCEKSADVDDNGALDLTDAVLLLQFLFQGGPAPAEPRAACGCDPTADALPCTTQESCR